MLARTWSLLVIVLLFFVACLTTPDFGYTGSSTTQKHDLRIALVISDELRNMTHEASMYTDCWWQEDQRSKNDKANLSANFDIGGPAEQLLIKGLTSLFTKVDVYKQSNDIRSKTEYDYIMIPSITIDTSYDKEAALNRWKRTNNSWLDYENAKIIIEAKATYVIKVIDPTANQVVGNIEAFYQDTNYEAKSFFGINVPPNCSPRLRHKSNNSLEKNYKKPIEVAMNKAFEDLIQKADAGIRPLALAKSQERALPSSLSLAIAFSDKDSFSPNNLLDAGETAQINVAVKNDGKGSGYNTVIKLSSDNPKVTFDKEISLGDVAPGETKNIKVNVKAALDLTDGTVPFTITCSEKRGYDCKRYNLNVSSAHFEKPGLMIAGYKINDSNTGLGQGNGNGIPENGEIIEIIPLVKNTGTGPALGVTLSIASISDGIEIKNKNVTIPQILPGQTVSGNLSFFIPSTFSGKSIEVTFNAVDTRGVSGSKAFALNTAINQPSLTYAYRIIDQKGNTRSDMQNGESGEIEIRPSNKGQLDAKNVSINLSSDTFSFSKSQDEIMRIGAQSEYTPIRFPFQVPRVTDKQSVNVAVKLTQKDFPGLTDTINVPLRLARPDLKVTHQVIGALQQGQAADLIVRVENIGQLDADEVVLSLDITKKGVLLHGNRQVTLGKIEAGRSSEPKKFSLTIQRIADTGELPVQYTVTEKTFGTKNLTLALNITREQEETITVKGEERPRPAVAASSYQNQPPIIVVASPRPNDRVASEYITLNGVVNDDRGVGQIDITLNGRRLDGRGVSVKARDAANPRERDFTERISLQPGANTIKIVAYDTENLSSEKTITVYRESKQGNIYAAVIGINRYKDSSLNLRYARNDAEAFASYMRTHMGLTDNRIIELYDEKATTRNIRSSLGRELRQRASKPEDTVYIFFAGHGAPEQDASSKDEDRIQKYILTYDSEKDDLGATAIPMDEIARFFTNINAERVVFIIDSCYSGAGGGRTILAHKTRAVLSDEFLNRLSQGKGRIILASSKPNQVSQESDTLKHGYFTYHLLEGLKGKADVSKDGIVDIDEIYIYLNDVLPKATNGGQNPVKKGEAEGQVVVGRVR